MARAAPGRRPATSARGAAGRDRSDGPRGNAQDGGAASAGGRRADARRNAGARQPDAQDGGAASAGGRRADARRNIAAILDAAQDCLARDPAASVADIARAAGVGRVTLYGHFASRAELVDAVFRRSLAQADAILDAVDLGGDPRQALTRLVASSWRILGPHSALLLAAERELPPGHIRAHHDSPMRRVEALISRGQRDGVFRADLPAPWLTAVFYNTMHGAVTEISAGRFQADDAARFISATLLAAYTPPGEPVPVPAPPHR